MDGRQKQGQLYMYMTGIPEATVVTVSTQDDQELQPLDIVDDRIYERFVIQRIPAERQRELGGRVPFTTSVVAYDGYGEILPLPFVVVNIYHTREAAHEVQKLCQRLFVGKSVTACNQMLGVKTHE